MKIASILAIGLAAAGLVVSASAQGPGGPGGRGGPGGFHRPKPGQMETDLLAKLDLNHAQKVKAKLLTDGLAKKEEAMFAQRSPGGDRSAMREKMKALRDDYNAHLSKILTKGQMDKYTKMRDEMRAKMRASMGGGRGRGGPGGPGGPRGGGR